MPFHKFKQFQEINFISEIYEQDKKRTNIFLQNTLIFYSPHCGTCYHWYKTFICCIFFVPYMKNIGCHRYQHKPFPSCILSWNLQLQYAFKHFYIDNFYRGESKCFQNIEMLVVGNYIICAGIEGAVNELVVVGVIVN